MGRGPAVRHEALPLRKPSNASRCVPSDSLATDSVEACGTSKMPIMTEPGGASSQSPAPEENNVVGTESHEDSNDEDDAGDVKATVAVRKMDPGNDVALEVQTIKEDNEDLSKRMIRQLETRPISDEQMGAEVKGIYAGLVMVESKCMEVDNELLSTQGPSLSRNAEHFQALIAIHSTLMHQYYDFFSASQHPSASPALKILATKYGMPTRTWRHGIHSLVEVLRKQLPEFQEFIRTFIILAYGMMSLMDETITKFEITWIECKADLARYGMATLYDSIHVEQQHWLDISKEQYTRVLDKQSTVGRIYHHLATLEGRYSRLEHNTHFDAIISQFFYYTKALVVEAPFYATLESVLTLIQPILAQNREAEKSHSVPQTDGDNFLTAVSHLILASLEPELLKKNGLSTSKEHHLQIVYTMLGKIGTQANTSRIRPSPQLGLLLCQLILGIPSANRKWSPMMTAWAPDLVTAEDYANIDENMEKARDIHKATIKMIDVMIPYLLKDTDTRNLTLWEFIYVILVFMRSLKTRPRLLMWFGSAFHAELFPLFINMALREDETLGGRALKSVSQSEVVTLFSPLNREEKLGDYGLTAEDTLRRLYHAREERRKAEGARSTATAEDATLEEATASAEAAAEDATAATREVPAEEDTVIPEEGTVINPETTTSDAAHERDQHTKAPHLDWMYANVLPEHYLLQGHFFAREAEPCGKSAAGSTEEVPLPEVVKESENEGAQQQDTKMREEEAGKPRQEEEKNREADESAEAEVRKQGGWPRDPPPLFPENWFNKGKYDFQERQVRMNYVQDAESCYDRWFQIVRLVYQLDVFFVSKIDEEGRYWVSVPGALPQHDPNMKMPEVVDISGGNRVVFVQPSFHAAEIAREKRRAEKEEARQEEDREKKEERQREKDEHAEAFADVATAVDEKTKGDAEEVSAANNTPKASQSTDTIEQQSTQSEKPINLVEAGEAQTAMVPEDENDQPMSAYSPSLAKIARCAKATTPAEKPTSEGMPSSTHEAEHTEYTAEQTKGEVEAALPVQDMDDPQDTKGSDAGLCAAATIAPADNQAAGPRASTQLTEGALDAISGTKNPKKAMKLWLHRVKKDGKEEEEDGDWVRISDESHKEDQTAQTAQASGRSMISRVLSRW